MADAARAVAGRLSGAEVTMAVSVVIAAYSTVLLYVHRQAVAASLDEAKSEPGYWGTLPSAWDHPEPNYVVRGIGEFWSVITTIPVAGAMLMYEGLRFGYSARVLRIYAVTFGMYTLAFSAHLTLQKLVFSTTVCAVMSNALLTFLEFSHVVHRVLHSPYVRGAIALLAEALLIGTVATLPYWLQAQGMHGGVWTLFVVQSPGVFLAFTLASMMARKARLAGDAAQRAVFSLVSFSGALLSTAMVLSFVECKIGFEHGIMHDFWGFPWLHICIHAFEQVGIYIFGVGVAALDSMLVPPLRQGAEVRYVGGWLAYLYCPHPMSTAAVGDTASVSEAMEPPAKPVEQPSDTAGMLVGRPAPAKLEKLSSFSSVSTEAPDDLPDSPASSDSPSQAPAVRLRRPRHKTPPPRAPRAVQ